MGAHDTVVEKHQRGQAAKRVLATGHVAGAERHEVQFVNEHKTVVAVGLAFFVAAQIARATEAELFAAEEIGAGKLRGAAGSKERLG